jgi:Uma2 family endonuclease
MEVGMVQAPQKPLPLIAARVTLEQYHRMVDLGIWDDRHVELLNGAVVEMSPEGMPHASRSTTTGECLREVLGSQVQQEFISGSISPLAFPDVSIDVATLLV